MNKEIITIIFWREMKGGVLVELFKKTADKNKMLLFPCLDSQMPKIPLPPLVMSVFHLFSFRLILSCLVEVHQGDGHVPLCFSR